MRIILALLITMALATSALASTVILQWDKSTDATVTGYEVHYQANTNVQPFSTTVDNETLTTATVTGLDPTKSYYFAVSAYNALGMKSGYSNVVTVPAFPAVPVGVKSVTISW